MKTKRILSILFIAIMIFVFPLGDYKALAEESWEDIPLILPTPTIPSGTLKIMVTADLHGQLTAKNYETGESLPEAGLSKLATLIDEERSETDSDTVLLDAGDVFYSYMTDFFYDYNSELIQPMYQAMKELDYDAITLGNHEFDFPFDYLHNQLLGAELFDKTVVSNLLYDENGEAVFAPSRVFYKDLKMSDGTTHTLSIGVVGATRSSLSSKRQRYSGYFCTEDIYESVTKESKRLKDNGVDLVIALIHGGIGLVSSDGTISPGSKLANRKDIDAVVTSHTHECFPTNTKEYDTFSNVNNEKGLIYNTPVVAVGSHAKNLGMISFTYTYDEKGELTISDKEATLLPVTETTKEDKSIKNLFSKYERTLEKKGDTRSFALAKGVTLTNYDCLVKDSALYQLINQAKLSFGASYIKEYLPQYDNMPLIAVTKNELDGEEPFLFLTEQITSSDVAKLISTASSTRPSGYIYLYKINGANLLEWLEYSASIYATRGTQFKTILPNFTKNHPEVTTLIKEEYLQDHSSFFAFDGISYEIDLTKPARYKADGTMLSYQNWRITNLKYQGKNVTNKQEFIIVSDTFEKNFWFMPTEKDSIYANFPYIESKAVVMDYLEGLEKLGPISIVADNNWCFMDSDGYEFAFGSSKDSLSYGKTSDWFYKQVNGLRIGMQFFWGRMVEPESRLQIVLSKGVTKKTGSYVPIKVTTVSLPKDASVSSVLFRKGLLDDPEDPSWSYGTVVTDGLFHVSDNAIYSVLVTDTLGNQTIASIVVDNFDPEIVASPTVEFVTNRRRAVNGTAIPACTVWIETEEGLLYSAIADENGKYSVELPPQPSDTTLKLWASEGDLVSEIVPVYVYRTGPNLPSVSPQGTDRYGMVVRLEENQTAAVIFNKTVYIEKGKSECYKKSGIYNSSYTIVEKDGYWIEDTLFYLPLPRRTKGTKYYLYAFDWQNRESLRTEFIEP